MLANAQIANADFTQTLVHICKHLVEQGLREFLRRLASSFQMTHDKKGVKRDHLEPTVDRIGNGGNHVKGGQTGLTDNFHI